MGENKVTVWDPGNMLRGYNIASVCMHLLGSAGHIITPCGHQGTGGFGTASDIVQAVKSRASLAHAAWQHRQQGSGAQVVSTQAGANNITRWAPCAPRTH